MVESSQVAEFSHSRHTNTSWFLELAFFSKPEMWRHKLSQLRSIKRAHLVLITLEMAVVTKKNSWSYYKWSKVQIKNFPCLYVLTCFQFLAVLFLGTSVKLCYKNSPEIFLLTFVIEVWPSWGQSAQWVYPIFSLGFFITVLSIDHHPFELVFSVTIILENINICLSWFMNPPFMRLCAYHTNREGILYAYVEYFEMATFYCACPLFS